MRAAAQIAALALVFTLGSELAAADSAYLGELEAVALTADEPQRVETLVRNALFTAGFQLLAASGSDPDTLAGCRDQAACIARWGRAAGVQWVLRASVARVGPGLVVAVEATRVASAERRVVVREQLVLEAEHDAVLASALAALLGTPPPGPRPARSRARTMGGWALVGGGVLIAGGAAWALFEADAREQDFRSHLNPANDIVGLTPGAARDMEDETDRLRRLGSVGLVFSGLAVAGGVVLLLSGRPTAAERTVSIGPLPGTGLGALVGGRF